MELFKMSLQCWLNAWEAQSKFNESVFRSLFSVLPKQQSKQAMMSVMSIHRVEKVWRDMIKACIR